LTGGGEHLHQLLALFRHVPAKHPLERRVDLEQAAVEEHRGIVGDRGDCREGLLHEHLLGRRQHQAP
jgi:hypothetical protein